MQKKKIINQYRKYVMPTYSRSDLTVVKGKGSYVWDEKNKKYLDFFPGWAVSALGHCHPNVIKNASRQLKDIIHVPNNYYNTKQAKLAKVIIDNSFDGKVFFGNSGAEAIEAAIKLARYYGYPKRHQIISMAQSFHGRTLAALSLTGQSKYKKGFKPLPSGFKHVEFNNFKALKKAVNKKTVAIVIEPIQGEGGINVADKQYLKKVRKLCNEKDILLIFDEIQTGMGRTGKMFAYQHYGVTPDAMTLAKALGGGFPISCLVASKKVCDVLGAGSHATTFGGSPIVCSASLGVFEAIKKEKLLKNVNKVAPYLLKKLNSLKQKYPDIIEKIKGIGLMIGIDLKCKGSRIVGIAKDNGLLINCTQENTLRMLPPLIINKKDVDKAVEILDKSIGKFKDEPR